MGPGSNHSTKESHSHPRECQFRGRGVKSHRTGGLGLLRSILLQPYPKKKKKEGLWFISVHAVSAPKGSVRLDFIFKMIYHSGITKVLFIKQILFYIGEVVLSMTINK